MLQSDKSKPPDVEGVDKVLLLGLLLGVKLGVGLDCPDGMKVGFNEGLIFGIGDDTIVGSIDTLLLGVKVGGRMASIQSSTI